MTDEEVEERFIKSYPQFCCNEKPLSPFWDIWEAGVEFGFNKVNEWHYVKDGLPDEGTYLVVWQNDKGYKEIFIMKYDEDDEERLHWVDGDYEVQDEYIIAWKEIVLPKLKESE